MNEESEIKRDSKPKKQKIKISEEERKILEKYKDLETEPEISNEEASILDILTKRKTIKQIRREFNFALKPLGKLLYTKEQILKLLEKLEEKNLIKKLKAPIGDVYVSIKHLRYTKSTLDKIDTL